MEEIKGMSDDTKVCTKCGIEKPVSDFYKRSTGKTRTYCKSCWKEYNRKYEKLYRTHHRDAIRSSSRIYRCVNRPSINSRRNSQYKCAKVFCTKVPTLKIIELICKCCGKKYGLPLAVYNARMKEREGKHPKYCSHECQWESMRKSWQQTQSPYAKKIKELRKIHGV